MTLQRSRIVLLGLLLWITLPYFNISAKPDRAREQKIDRAIDRGIQWLLREVERQQVGKHMYGQVALETYALVTAGVSVDHPQIRKNFALLKKRLRGGTHTYSISCYVFALDAAIAQLELDRLLMNPGKLKPGFQDDPSVGRPLRSELQTAIRTLVQNQNGRGAWRYFRTQDVDNSNTQFAVLALGIGAKRGIPIDDSVWDRLVAYFEGGQQKNGPETSNRLTLIPKSKRAARKNVEVVKKKKKKRSRRGRTGVTTKPPPTPEENPDKYLPEDIKVHSRGWDYENKGGATWNMTCAGVSSLLVAREQLRGERRGDEFNQLNRAIRDGFGWVMDNWSLTKTYYGLYSLEKVADIGGVQKFGGNDWYRQATDFLLSKQQQNGVWKGTGEHHEDDRIATSFALLVLNRATTLLTADHPASSIIISGKRNLQKEKDRAWVYVAKLDTHLHFPSVLKAFQKRPNEKLAAFLRTMIDSYPDQWRGELIPGLLTARETAERKSIRRVLDQHLERITGTPYDDPQMYATWHKQWDRINKIVKVGKSKYIPHLLRYYEDNLDSVAMKQKASWGLIQLKARKAVPLLVKDLKHDVAGVRANAYSCIRSFYIDPPPPYNATADMDEIETAADAVAAWVKDQEKKRGK